MMVLECSCPFYNFLVCTVHEHFSQCTAIDFFFFCLSCDSFFPSHQVISLKKKTSLLNFVFHLTQPTPSKWNGLQLDGRRALEPSFCQPAQQRRREHQRFKVHFLLCLDISCPGAFCKFVSWHDLADAPRSSVTHSREVKPDRRQSTDLSMFLSGFSQAVHCLHELRTELKADDWRGHFTTGVKGRVGQLDEQFNKSEKFPPQEEPRRNEWLPAASTARRRRVDGASIQASPFSLVLLWNLKLSASCARVCCSLRFRFPQRQVHLLRVQLIESNSSSKNFFFLSEGRVQMSHWQGVPARAATREEKGKIKALAFCSSSKERVAPFGWRSVPADGNCRTDSGWCSSEYRRPAGLSAWLRALGEGC